MSTFTPHHQVTRILIPEVGRTEILRRTERRLFEDYGKFMQAGDLQDAFACAESLVVLHDLLAGFVPQKGRTKCAKV